MRSVKEIADGMLAALVLELSFAAERLRVAGWGETQAGWQSPMGGPLLGTLAADDARREEARDAER